MAIDSQATWQLVDALKDTSKTNEHTSLATVNRIDTEGRVWVSLPGGEVETPTETSNAEVKRGDTVTVEWRGNKLYILGNSSNPSVGAQRVDVIDELANQAYQSATEASANAGIAKVAADNAQASADQAATAAATADQKATAASTAASQAQTDAAAAQTAASNAQTAASSAQTSAQQAVADAATAGRAASVAQAAAEAAQGDIDEMEEWFWHDTNGSHVLGATSGYRNDITSTGMEIVETSSQDVVAEFGANGAVIGKQDETHAEIDYHSLQLIDKEGNAYFHVNDLVDASGKVEITKSYISDGTTYIYILAPEAKDTNYSVKVDGSEWSSGLTKNLWNVVFDRVPAAGSNIVITYETDINDAKAFTFGTRGQGNVGALSVAIGKDVVASEFLSYAEGDGAVASDILAHAQGLGTIANTRSQTVIGEYNIADNSRRPYDYGSYAFIIGNGYSDSSRSNAFTVAWDGNTEAAGDITDGSGNVLSDKADSADVYTKTQADTLLADKADSADVYTKTQADALLADKADTTDLADYLPLVGGTLTGALDQDMPGIVRNTPPSSAQWIDRIALCDANGEVIGYLRTPFQTDGREGIQIETKRTVNGSDVYNGVQFYIDASGTRTVEVSDLAAWRDALALGSLAQKDSLSATDIPSLPASKISSGVLSKARGGTGTADFGTVQNTNGSTKSVANSTNTELTNFTLAAGTWLVVAGFTFAANSTGRRVMSIDTTSGTMSNARTQQLSLRATDGGRMDGEVVSILSPTSSTTYYANCWQNSGGALDASAYVRAIRLA